MNKNHINICYALNDSYVPYCGASMVSLLENNPGTDVTFHILTDELTENSIAKLQNWAKQYGAQVYVYHIDDSLLKGQKTTWSKYGWYRIFAPEVITEDVEELLYLDCDTIITGNITDIFYRNGKEWSLAAVEDYMSIFPDVFNRVGYEANKGYFCSGVLLMNLNYFREHDLSAKILRFALENPERIQFPDQDALNYMCKESKVSLPLKYGILDPFYRDKQFILKYGNEVREALEDPRIAHYAGCAPWIKEYQHHYYADEFWKYANLIGGIKSQHYCTGLSLLFFTAKRTLAKLRVNKYKQFMPLKRVEKEDVIRIIKTQK